MWPTGKTEDVCGLRPPTDLVPAELCLSVNETLDIVDYGAAGWSLLIGKIIHGSCIVCFAHARDMLV